MSFHGPVATPAPANGFLPDMWFDEPVLSQPKGVITRFYSQLVLICFRRNQVRPPAVLRRPTVRIKDVAWEDYVVGEPADADQGEGDCQPAA